MKKGFLFVVFAVMLFSLSVSSPVNAYVSSVNFVGSLFRGYDSFYDSYVVAYEAGANVTAVVAVYNDYYGYYGSAPVNVSAVKIGFDWGTNYSSVEATEDTPVQIQPYQTQIFRITFKLPTDVSNLVIHSYKVYVEHVDRLTGTPKNIVGAWTYTNNNFAVYAADQADAQDLY